MKRTSLFIFGIAAALSCASSEAGVYVAWAFNGPGGSYTSALTSSTFPGTPTFTRLGSETGGISSNGGIAYINPTYAINYTSGQAVLWNGNADGQGNGFTLTLNTSGLTDLTFRMDLRSAQSSSGLRAEAFSSITYDIGQGPVPITGVPGFDISTNDFKSYGFSLSGLTAIENQANVVLHFGIPDQNKPGNSANLRLDNLLITAVPEPSAALLVLGGMGLSAFRRRRRF
jgi:hypothetical protein